jgi:menaquinone-dependent protoporphyrinogen oxidase
MRVVVVYGSSRGGTAGLARMIAEALVDHDVLADLGEANTVDDLESYDAVIVGGALYNQRWHPDATWFVERNLEALRATKVWFFSSGPLDNSARSGALAPLPQVRELARRADVRGHMTFGGMLEPKPSKLLSLMSWGKPGDYRDPQQVAEWVELIVPRLGEAKATIVLPDAPLSDGEDRLAARVLRRLAAAGEEGDESAEDLGLDVLLEVSEG